MNGAFNTNDTRAAVGKENTV